MNTTTNRMKRTATFFRAALLLTPLAALFAAKPEATTTVTPVAIPAAALRADPWVIPPRSAAEMRERLAELRQEYAPFLRSLPPKLAGRKRQSLDGEWRGKFEIRDSLDGVIPPSPNWFGVDLDEKTDGGWESVTVPHWRWSTKRDKTQFMPWYPESPIVWYRKKFTAQPPARGARTFLVFAGVDWAAQVWLNGKWLGEHSRYWEPFQFDVTTLLQPENLLAVRVIDGPAFGEPISHWSVLPFTPSDKLEGKKQEFVMGRPDPSVFYPGGGTSGGSGFGIHREVTLETTADACVSAIFARGYPATEMAKVAVETDALAARTLTLAVTLLPENFDGPSFHAEQRVELARGAGRHEFSIPMSGARWWWPREPFLYRCRVKLLDDGRLMDARDALFGVREVSLVSPQRPRPGWQDGQLLLNGQPVFLRGTSVGGPNLAWYWGDTNRVIDIALLTKAANFNAIRNNQHIAFPEVLEYFDRLGILSQQEQGTGIQKRAHDPTMDHLADVVAPMARVLYNHPGVILFSFMNETHANMTKPVAAVLRADPERLLVPISGALFSLDEPKYGGQLLGCFHNYDAWYGGFHNLWDTAHPRVPGRRVLDDFHDANPKPPKTFFPIMTPDRMTICGEYGAEALDNYEAMMNYPPHWGQTPALTDDVIWGFPVGKGNPLNRQYGWRGQTPRNLGDYIASSQNLQADILVEATKGFRLSQKAIVGYYLYHFLDISPANWPKTVLSYDLTPKRSFFEMAQVNQPIVPLYRLLERGTALEFWVSNDLAVPLPACRLAWQLRAGDRDRRGQFAGDIPASDAVRFGRVELNDLPAHCDQLDLTLVLRDAQNQTIAEYARQLYFNFDLIDREAAAANLRTTRGATWKKENVALKQSVHATSTGATTPAANAVDGNPRSAWQAATRTLAQSLTVDLGEPVTLCGARIVWPGRGQRTVRFDVSADATEWAPITGDIREATEDAPSASANPVTQYFAFTGKARHVRVTLTAVPENQPIGFNELELYKK